MKTNADNRPASADVSYVLFLNDQYTSGLVAQNDEAPIPHRLDVETAIFSTYKFLHEHEHFMLIILKCVVLGLAVDNRILAVSRSNKMKYFNSNAVRIIPGF